MAQIRIVGVSRNISKIIYVHHTVMVADLCHFETRSCQKAIADAAATLRESTQFAIGMRTT